MYIQTLYKVLKNHIKPKVLSRMNRYNKWEYGYNEDHDMVVISKTGQIGEVYEIQNLKIAHMFDGVALVKLFFWINQFKNKFRNNW